METAESSMVGTEEPLASIGSPSGIIPLPGRVRELQVTVMRVSSPQRRERVSLGKDPTTHAPFPWYSLWARIGCPCTTTTLLLEAYIVVAGADLEVEDPTGIERGVEPPAILPACRVSAEGERSVEPPAYLPEHGAKAGQPLGCALATWLTGAPPAAD